MVGKGIISGNRDHSKASIFKRISPPPVFVPVVITFVVWAVDEYADAGGTAALIIEIWLEEHIVCRRILSEIREPELICVEVVLVSQLWHSAERS